MKTCKKCGRTLPISDFYTHKMMGDGHLSFCKDCVRERVASHRAENIDRIRLYDRLRGRTEERRAKSREFQRLHKEIHQASLRRWDENNPEKKQAHRLVRYAIKSGKMERGKCFCGEIGEAHHDDYSKPLDVRWLCVKHHKEHHRRYKDDDTQTDSR